MKSNIIYKVGKALHEGKSYEAISTAYNVDYDFIRVVSKMKLDIEITKPVPRNSRKEFEYCKANVNRSSFMYGFNPMLSEDEDDYGTEIPTYKYNDKLESERFFKNRK